MGQGNISASIMTWYIAPLPALLLPSQRSLVQDPEQGPKKGPYRMLPVAPSGSHTRQLGPREDHMDPLELGSGLGVETTEGNEADPAGPAISSLPSLRSVPFFPSSPLTTMEV